MSDNLFGNAEFNRIYKMVKGKMKLDLLHHDFIEKLAKTALGKKYLNESGVVRPLVTLH